MFSIPLNSNDFYDDNEKFISQLNSSSAHNSNNQQQIIQDQCRQSQECLETSEMYMKEIDCFFRELSVVTRPVPTPPNNSPTTSSFLFDAFDVTNFDLNATIKGNSTNEFCEVIDPAIIFNIGGIDRCRYSESVELRDILSDYAENEDNADIEDIEDIEDEVYVNHHAKIIKPSDKFGVIKFPKHSSENKRSIRKQRDKLNLNSFSDSSRSSPKSQSLKPSSNSNKTPKFYSRSGQVADPNRGPCHNCSTTLTCYWRKLDGLYYCNACTLFYKRNNFHRNVKEITIDKPIKRRNRKSKYSEL